MRLHLPSVLLPLPLLAGAILTTLGVAAPSVELADVPRSEPARSTGPCRLLPADQQPPRTVPAGAPGAGQQRIVVFVPATTCNTTAR